jgi:hypothetical protein
MAFMAPTIKRSRPWPRLEQRSAALCRNILQARARR